MSWILRDNMTLNNKTRLKIITHFKNGGTIPDAALKFKIDYVQAYGWRKRVLSGAKHRMLPERGLIKKLKGLFS